VLDKYPPKDPSLSIRGPPTPPAPVPAAAARPPSPAPSGAGPSPAAAPADAGAPRPLGLISLERPFDPDEFAELLGQTAIRVEVPREHLPEVLRRVSEFMGFGIYVYTIRVSPGPGEMLKGFVVELDRVDFSPEKGGWIPFEEKGRSDSPFGPTGGRR
jgi:hypothetical protein